MRAALGRLTRRCPQEHPPEPHLIEVAPLGSRVRVDHELADVLAPAHLVVRIAFGQIELTLEGLSRRPGEAAAVVGVVADGPDQGAGRTFGL
jgi:hypothetical protein